ncbi:MAG TPA: hypothetical protein VK979_00225 [Guyparkeria sp.]|nr:hypothetical protein [Guyparkeria sp.]
MKALIHPTRPLAIIAIVIAATFATTAQAQPDQAASYKAAVHQAVHGLTQAQVIARFGEPEKRHAPVPAHGKPPTPPISRWDYSDFSIYFENHIALHRVEHRKFSR